jgi:hypothetical protein
MSPADDADDKVFGPRSYLKYASVPDSGPRFSPDEIEASSGAMAPDPPTLKYTALGREERQPLEMDLGKLDEAIVRRRHSAPQD